jgi:hypothetical protein
MRNERITPFFASDPAGVAIQWTLGSILLKSSRLHHEERSPVDDAGMNGDQ